MKTFQKYGVDLLMNKYISSSIEIISNKIDNNYSKIKINIPKNEKQWIDCIQLAIDFYHEHNFILSDS